jgi:hypothetical protein
MLALPLSAATTNYLSVVGKTMQGHFLLIDSTNTPCSPTNISGYSRFITVGQTVESWGTEYFGTLTGCGYDGWWVSANDMNGTQIPCHSCVSNNYLLWLKADAGVYSDAGPSPTVPAINGQPVGQWNDQSGHGYNATTNVAGGYAPIYVTNAANGLPAVKFEGLGTEGLLSSNASYSMPYAIFVVFKPMGNASGTLYESVNRNGTNGQIILEFVNNNNLEMYGGDGINGNILQSDISIPTNALTLVTCVFNGDSSVLRINGAIACPACTNDSMAFSPAFSVATEPRTSLLLEANMAQDVYYFEVIITTDLSQVGSTEAYLKTKYGL